MSDLSQRIDDILNAASIPYAIHRTNIPKGAWLYDLGRPTPHAVLIKCAYELQQEAK